MRRVPRHHRATIQPARSEAKSPAGVEGVGIAAADRFRLLAVANEASREEAVRFDRFLPEASDRARTAASHWAFTAPADAIDRMLQHRVSPAGNVGDRTRLRRVAVARLALEYFRIEDRLPESIKEMYPDFLARLAKFLDGGFRDEYDNDYFAKDVRYALGLTIPAGTFQFDLDTPVGPKLIVRDALATRSLYSTFRYAACLGWRRWYGNHLDLRAMKQFTPDGWIASFARIAELLELNPTVRGVAGVAWFYDPAVARISPHLAYLQTPATQGGFLIKMPTPPHDVQNALIRSTVRKKLYVEGKYSPTCYLLAWPRRPLLAWAQRLKGDRSAGSWRTISAPAVVGEPERVAASSATAR